MSKGEVIHMSSHIIHIIVHTSCMPAHTDQQQQTVVTMCACNVPGSSRSANADALELHTCSENPT